MSQYMFSIILKYWEYCLVYIIKTLAHFNDF